MALQWFSAPRGILLLGILVGMLLTHEGGCPTVILAIASSAFYQHHPLRLGGPR